MLLGERDTTRGGEPDVRTVHSGRSLRVHDRATDVAIAGERCTRSQKATTMNHSPQHNSETASRDVSEHDFRTALVLGGGGSTGNAWLIGVIAGLFDAGLDVTQADLTIGTSAGSTAAAQPAGATPTELRAAILPAAPRQRSGPVGSDRGRAPARLATSRAEPLPRSSPNSGADARNQSIQGSARRSPVCADSGHRKPILT